MSDQKFADTHNLVSFLEKPTESESSGILSKQKTVNGKVQLQALVDKKKVIITESIIRRELQLEDAEGNECLPTATIFEELTRMGYEKLTQKLTFYKVFFSPQWKFLIHTILQCLSAKTTAWNEFSSNMASKEMGEGSANLTDPHHTPIITQPSISQPQKKQKPRKQKRKDTELPQSNGPTEPITEEAANEESVPTHSNDPLLNGEDNLKLNELMELCTNLQKKVLDLETTKTIQALEIDSLKRRVKKLEKKQRSRTHKLRRLYKVGLSAKVISSDDEASLGDQEDASKQGRKILDIDADEDITLDSTHVDTDPDMFGVHDLHGDEVFVEIEEPVVNAATTTTTTATTTVADEVEMTLAQTLIEIKSAKPKAKGIVMQEPSESTPTISSQQPSQVKGQGSKDKATLREKEEVLCRLAAKRAEEKRNRPPTKAQQRSILCTYLKNMEGWKPKDLKTKSFANVQELFDKAMKRVNTFVDFRTELVEGTEREESSKRDETIGQESSSKRAGDELEQEKAKKQKIDDAQ
ncbi:hypothetical protein Tco_1151330 [Tanacetum coccineum]